ncbi:MAG: hypothetical protein J6S02_08160 [Bacteroidaceae bacterium]|nr:hypothetical protein [Bacteroidaceae bacterium]
MKNLIITLALLLVSQISVAQTLDDMHKALDKVEGVEVVKFPSFLVKMMNKGMKGKSKIEQQTMIANETHPQEFLKQLDVELQKLLDNGFKLQEKPAQDGLTMRSYILGDEKYAYEIVYQLVGEDVSPMIITLKGKMSYENLKGDLTKVPKIDANFLKRAEEMVDSMF